MTEITLGSKFRTIVTILLDLTIFTAGIPNLLVGTCKLNFSIKEKKLQLVQMVK